MFVQTKASLLKKNAETLYESVTFQNRKKKVPKSAVVKDERDAVEGKAFEKPEINDMKKLRYEVIKFGTSGFKGDDKEEANVAYMVSLGAAPPKRAAKNYKELLLEKKREKEKQKSSSAVDGKKYKSLIPKLSGHSKPGSKRKREVKGLLDVYGEVKKKKGRPKRKGKSKR